MAKTAPATLKRIAEQKQLVVEYFRTVPVIRHAAGHAKVSEDTVARWRKDDPEFAEQLNQARAAFIRLNVKKARPEFLLERLDKDIFKESVETTNEIVHKFEELPDDELDRAIKARKDRLTESSS